MKTSIATSIQGSASPISMSRIINTSRISHNSQRRKMKRGSNHPKINFKKVREKIIQNKTHQLKRYLSQTLIIMEN